VAVQARWTFSLYPDAAEGGGCLVRARVADGGRAGPADPARAQEEAGRRARAKVRRYCAANRLNRFGTLTYAESCRDPRQLRGDVAGFFRGLRRELGGAPLPYAWTSEWHPGGHGLHVHFAVARFVPQRLIRDVWGRGIVHIKLIGDLPQGSGALDEARVAATYLAKYASKSLDDDRRAAGLHRYEVAQGFQPAKVECHGVTAEDVIERASRQMGSLPDRVWLSARAEGWRGPHACWAQWR